MEVGARQPAGSFDSMWRVNKLPGNSTSKLNQHCNTCAMVKKKNICVANLICP